jgi:hypothetical protein
MWQLLQQCISWQQHNGQPAADLFWLRLEASQVSTQQMAGDCGFLRNAAAAW